MTARTLKAIIVLTTSLARTSARRSLAAMARTLRRYAAVPPPVCIVTDSGADCAAGAAASCDGAVIVIAVRSPMSRGAGAPYRPGASVDSVRTILPLASRQTESAHSTARSRLCVVRRMARSAAPSWRTNSCSICELSWSSPVSGSSSSSTGGLCSTARAMANRCVMPRLYVRTTSRRRGHRSTARNTVSMRLSGSARSYILAKKRKFSSADRLS